MPRARQLDTRRRLLGAALVLLYVAATYLGRETRPTGSNIALAWPAAGVGVWLLMLVRGRRELLPAAGSVVLAAAAVNLLTGLTTTAAVVFAVVNLAHAVVGAALVRRLLPGAVLTEPGHVGRLLLASFAVSSLSGTASATTAWLLLGEAFDGSLLLFVVRNGGTTFLVLATVLSLSPPHDRRELVPADRFVELALVGLASLGSYLFVFLAPGGLPILFLALAASVLAGTKLGVPRAGALAMVLSAVSVWATVTGHGALAAVTDVRLRAVLVQAFAVTVVLVSLSLATSTRARDAVSAELAQALRRSEEADRSALIGKAVVVKGADGGWSLVRANPALVQLLGRDPSGLRWRELLRPQDAVIVRAAVDAIASGTAERWQGQVVHVTAAGADVCTQLHVSRLSEPGGREAVVAQVLDVTESVAAQRELERRASHDVLTGLPDRSVMIDHVERLLRDEATGGTAVLFLDLDRFKAVNDTHGHAAGDRLLRQVAAAVRDHLRPGDLVSRIGGDEFVVSCAGVAGPGQAEGVVRRLQMATRAALLLDGQDVGVTVSVGYALDEPGDDAASLLQRADKAMYQVKRAQAVQTLPAAPR